MIIWGVDPGVHGAIGRLTIKDGAVVRASYWCLAYHVWTSDMGFKILDREIYIASGYKTGYKADCNLVVMEEPLKTMAKGGHRSGGGLTLAASWFNFGRLYAEVEDVCDCPMMVIQANVWKGKLGLPANKDKCIDAALERYGGWIGDLDYLGQKTRSGVCEALLIAEYGWKTYGAAL